ncbi:amidohydrolase family protein [Salegentibacter sp. UBA1130]|uniref:amidohydrolase family protein n=1 Tax=Salegentibacter sp. UBA1130 TaxID=1947451 RepID=UPI00257A4232|nr:amidohydrolase family protein [Salegentibacter sp. UBA1130]
MSYPERIIDIHTHIFNLKYLPIKGVMISRGINPTLAAGIEKILIALTGNYLNYNRYNISKFINLQDPNFEKDLFNFSMDDLVKDIGFKTTLETFESIQVQKALLHFAREKKVIEFFETENIDNLSENHEFLNIRLPYIISSFVRHVFETIEDGLNYLRWFLFMTLGEEKIIERMKNSYPSVQTFVFHMIDADWFFERNFSTYNIDQMLNNMSYLQEVNSELVGFAPYNPMRGTTGLRKIFDLIKMKKFRGIKFYPPLGYKPVNNSNFELNNLNYELFDLCLEHEIPIFTHCTPTGFEAIPHKSGLNSDPEFWEELLNQPKYARLKVCFGHAGGEDGWFAEYTPEDENLFPPKTEKNFYAELVYKLCINYENVFCEVGFLEHQQHKNGIANMQNRLEEIFRIDESGENKYEFRNKVIYGSDWHILFNHGLELNYINPYIKLFTESEILKKYSDRFFYKNAEIFLSNQFIEDSPI